MRSAPNSWRRRLAALPRRNRDGAIMPNPLHRLTCISVKAGSRGHRSLEYGSPEGDPGDAASRGAPREDDSCAGERVARRSLAPTMCKLELQIDRLTP